MDIAPDLSHLTEDERKIIEAVINRQKAEEKRDAQTLQSRMDDYSAPVAMAGRRHSQQSRTHSHERSPGNESGVCCEVCQKTKFVGEQSARQCSICRKRFCVRCGVRLKGNQSTKTFWLCNICRQKQDRYFSSRKLIPTTSSVSQLTTASNNVNHLEDENAKHISKQYVSDYILSQPFETNEKEDEEMKINQNGASKNSISTTMSQRKRLLPTTHLRRQPPPPSQQQEKPSKDGSSSEQDEGAVSSPDSASAIDDNESVPRGNMLANDTWQKEEILAAKLESFLKTPTTTWRVDQNRTEQIGYVHLKNNTWTSTIRDEYEQGKTIKRDIFSALGLKIQGGIRRENEDGSVTMIAEITEVTPDSIADNGGQLQIRDQVLEWNGQKLTDLSYSDVYRIISQNSMQSADIHMIVKRPIRYSTLSSHEQSFPTPPSIASQENESTATTTGTKRKENQIRLQLALQYHAEQRELLVTVHGARDLTNQQGLLACQLSIQYGRDSLSKEEKCTKPQACVSGNCTWKQRLNFFDIATLEKLSLWIKLIDLDRNQEILGEICIPLHDPNLNLHGTSNWYPLTTSTYASSRQLPRQSLVRNDSDTSELEPHHDSSFNQVLPNESFPAMIDNTLSSSRKRQLPNIPAAQLHANREKVSQDLNRKAKQLKLRLHMQQQQRSFNENNINEKRQMYEDRIQIFNNEANRSTSLNPSAASQRSSFQSSKSIDTDSPHIHQSPLVSKAYESMTNLDQKSTGLKDKASSRPRLPFIRDKSVPNAPHLNPALARRTTSSGQHRMDLEKAKLKSFEEKYRRAIKKRDSSETPGDDVDSDGSELSTVSKNSSVSMLSTQSERPRNIRRQNMQTRLPDHHYHRNEEVQLNEEELRQMAMRTHDTITHPQPLVNSSKTDSSSTQLPSSSSIPLDKLVNTVASNKVDPRNDGTLSDSVLSTQPESNKKRRPSMSSKALVILGLSKKTNSTSNLGYGKRFGFQRSEEIGVQPHLRSRTLQKQTSKENETPSTAPALDGSQSPLVLSHQREQHHSMPNDMKLWSGGLKLPHEHQFAEFIEGLGAGQLVGRQVLASPCHGEIQVGLRDQHGTLEVEIVRARNLLKNALYKLPPAPYVKVYLLDGKTCMEKQRTRTTRRTLDPLIQQTLIFKENYRDKVLQIGVWGDYGKLDRKVFMGVCQINVEELHLSSAAQVLDWFKLFSANSLMNNYTIVQQSPRRRTSMATNDSFSSLKTNSRLA